MEEAPLTKDPSTQPENYSSMETEEAPKEEKQPEESQEKKKEEEKKSVPKKKVEAKDGEAKDGDKGNSNFTLAIVLSCLTFWLCGFVFGGIAFILAIVGKHKADSGNAETSGRLKTWSYVLSAIGIIIGLVCVILLVLFFVVLHGNTPFHG